MSSEGKKVDGLRQAAELLAGLDAPPRERILGEIEAQNPELAQKLKKGMVTLRQVFEMPPTDLAKVLRNVPADWIPLALRGLDSGLLDLFFKSTTERQGQQIREEMAASAPRKQSDVRVAQDRIIETAREMSQKGEIETKLP